METRRLRLLLELSRLSSMRAVAGSQPEDQLRTPSTGSPPGSARTTYAGSSWL